MTAPAAPRETIAPPAFFAFRTPLLPFDAFLSLGEGLRWPDAPTDSTGEALEADRRLQRERLRALVARPEVREALFLASPDLDDALDAWLREPKSDKGQRAERAIVKYVSRMAGRATPFGLFAGGSVGYPGDRTRFQVAPLTSARRRSRLDMDYLVALGEAVGADPALRADLLFHPNDTLYPAGSRLRYVEVRVTGRERSHHLVAVEETAYLTATLERAATGATLASLAEGLVSEDVTREVADAYVAELADAQVLVPDVGLAVTGPEPGRLLIETLGARPSTRPIAERLDEMARGLADLDAAGPVGAPAAYRALAERLAGLPVRPELPRLFQVDVVTGSTATLGAPVLEEVRRGLELLHRIAPVESSSLRAFREAFTERYEEREVPLAEALDEERGIGFPAYADEDPDPPLLAALHFPGSGDEKVPWGARERHLLWLVTRAAARGEEEIVLSDADVEALSVAGAAPLPGAFAALLRIGAESDDALDRGDFQVVIDSAGGPSGASFLGRFCHADPELRRLVDEHLRAEEALDPDAVFAEIVHLPEGRTGNVISRPLFRAYEIPFLGTSGAPQERQIPVTDLLVSVRGDEVRLRSRRLGRRVVPRLTVAHNYAEYGLGLYRFLCVLQASRHASGILWRWGALAAAPFLPRLRRGRIVLAPARWSAGKEELRRLAAARGADRMRSVAAWREERRLPRFVLLADPGVELPVDLASPLSVDAFLALAKERDGVELKEVLPAPEDLCARGPEGRHVHELLIPYVMTRPPRRETPPATAPPPPSARTFPPGSEWLYAKLYAGAPTIDRILVEEIEPLVRPLLDGGAADRWFFVRYADPRPHLRLRIHGDPRRLREETLPALATIGERLLASGDLWRLQLDTYDREVERYGGPEAIEIAERAFFADSEAVLGLLPMLEPGAAGDGERWRLGLWGSDALLRDLGLGAVERRELVAGLRRGFAEEHREDGPLKRALGETFRSRSRELGALLAPDGGGLAASPLAPAVPVFARRTERLALLGDELRALERDGRLGRPLSAFGANLVHLFLNRLLRSAHRRQELVLYDFLGRLHASSAARREET